MSTINILILIALALWAIFVMYGATYVFKVVLDPLKRDEMWWETPTTVIVIVVIVITVVLEILVPLYMITGKLP